MVLSLSPGSPSYETKSLHPAFGTPPPPVSKEISMNDVKLAQKRFDWDKLRIYRTRSHKRYKNVNPWAVAHGSFVFHRCKTFQGALIEALLYIRNRKVFLTNKSS